LDKIFINLEKMNKEYSVFNRFFLRTPSIPLNDSELRDKKEFINNIFFKEAIYIASRELYSEMVKFLEGNVFEKKEEEKLLFTLEKYWRRIRTRATPYGLFSGVTIGQIKEEQTKVLFDNTFKRCVRLDSELLYELIDSLHQIKEVKDKIHFFPNDTIYIIYNKLRFIERLFENTVFKYVVSSADSSVYLKKIILYSKTGRTISEIINYLLSIENNISYSEAQNFIEELINSDILISELMPNVVGEDILNKTIDIFIKRKIDHSLTIKLQKIKEKLSNFRNQNKSDLTKYQDIIDLLGSLRYDINKKNIFQVDLYKNTTKSILDKKITDDILAAILFSTRYTPYKKNNNNLERFKKLFSEKFEDREIDLLFALDADVGIGYPPTIGAGEYNNDLIKNFHTPFKEAKENTINWDSNQSEILNKIINASKTHSLEVIIDEKDIPNNKVSINLNPTFFCNFEILNFENNNYLLKLNSFGDNSGANILTRFSYMDDEVEEFVNIITNKEQELCSFPIFELSHIPYPRIGNIISRPKIRNYELTILSNTENSEFRIPVSDLTISVRNNDIILKSKKLNQIIKVAHTNVYNYEQSTVPIFKFLCDLQYDTEFLFGASIKPNIPLEFVPRIKYNNVILSVATWNLSKKSIESAFKQISTDNIIDTAKKWLESNNIPRYVLYSEGDNELFLDFYDEISIRLFLILIKKKNIIILKEFLFTDNHIDVSDINKKIYKNEFIIAFHKN